MMPTHDDILTIPDELLNALQARAHAGVLVVGIGSPNSGDSVGWRLADLIGQQALPGVVVRRALVPLDLLDWWEDTSEIHLIDALQCPPGTAPLRCWRWPECAELSSSATTSHSFDIISVLNLASALGRTTSGIFIWGVAS